MNPMDHATRLQCLHNTNTNTNTNKKNKKNKNEFLGCNEGQQHGQGSIHHIISCLNSVPTIKYPFHHTKCTICGTLHDQEYDNETMLLCLLFSSSSVLVLVDLF